MDEGEYGNPEIRARTDHMRQIVGDEQKEKLLFLTLDNYTIDKSKPTPEKTRSDLTRKWSLESLKEQLNLDTKEADFF